MVRVQVEQIIAILLVAGNGLTIEVVVLGDHFLRGNAPVEMPLPAVGLGRGDGAVAVVDIDAEASRGRLIDASGTAGSPVVGTATQRGDVLWDRAGGTTTRVHIEIETAATVDLPVGVAWRRLPNTAFGAGRWYHGGRAS